MLLLTYLLVVAQRCPLCSKYLVSDFFASVRYPWICPWPEPCPRVPRPSLAARPQAPLIVVHERVARSMPSTYTAPPRNFFYGAGYELRAKESSG